jgi:hypothetical protein
MAIKDLEGKRIGRRRGSRSRPPWERDLRWAYKNLGKPDAEPPSDLARSLRELGREHPDKFYSLLQAPAANEPNGIRSGNNGAASDSKLPQRVRRISIDARHLMSRLTKDGSAVVSNLPRDAYIVACEEESARDELVLTIYSDSFPPVEAGAVIPEIALEYRR